MNKNQLNDLRKQIDELDKQMIALLAKRMSVVKEVGEYKKQNNIPPLDEKRWQEVLQSRIAIAEKLGLSGKLVSEIYEVIHRYALEMEK